MTDLAQQLVAEEEGPSSPHVYYIGGLAHIGRGVLIDSKIVCEGIPPQILEELDEVKLNDAKRLAAMLPGWAQCNEVRQAVLVSMCYQLGGLDLWPHFRAALRTGDYVLAANNMLYKDGTSPTSGPSNWHIQTPARCEREAAMLRLGTWQER